MFQLIRRVSKKDGYSFPKTRHPTAEAARQIASQQDADFIIEDQHGKIIDYKIT
jgi:hypothetical protein